MITLPARPESLTFAPQQSALIVVDMQNAYASQGSYLDLAGFDVSATRPVIDNINTAVAAARAAGMLIIWFQNGWDDQYVEAGGPGSPNYHKSNALKNDASASGAAGQAAGERRLGLSAGGRADAAGRRYRVAETALQRLLLTPRSTAFCAAAAYATWCSPGSPPTSASNRRCAMASFSNTSASCWRMPPIRPARPSPAGGAVQY
ncbi:amidohydrolase RutB in pyrimidine catabolism pathway [Klebsiella pneumoniae]|nr:amidohydrolase RutB in pyrimidine catabolism pathway [Klebsiella pneumoniae]